MSCGKQAANYQLLQAAHPRKLAAGHEIAIQLSSGDIYCFLCQDFVYSQLIDENILAMILHTRGNRSGNDQFQENLRDLVESCDMSDGFHSEVFKSSGSCSSKTHQLDSISSDKFPSGLRGLNNMGHTCFMNSVLQVILHSPLMKEFFLQGNHTHDFCKISSSGGTCIACELSRVFSEVYCGDRVPYSPVQFLNAWWALAGGALGSGCKQQDAHEFFLFILEMLSVGVGNLPQNVYSGELRSDVTCSKCGKMSSTLDKFSHVSFDVQPWGLLMAPPILSRASFSSAKQSPKKRNSMSNKRRNLVSSATNDGVIFPTLSTRGTNKIEMNGDISSMTEAISTGNDNELSGIDKPHENNFGDDSSTSCSKCIDNYEIMNISSHPALASYLKWPGVSLFGCLRRFVWPEELDCNECPSCPCCGSCSGAVKQLSFVRLPPILVFHAKRFEHTGGIKSASRKLDTYISFPLDNLDMRDFSASKALKEFQGFQNTFAMNSKVDSHEGLPSYSNIEGINDARPFLRRTRSQSSSGKRPMNTPNDFMKDEEANLETGSNEEPRSADAVESKENDALYDLIGVICHSGNFSGGHYIAYVRATNNNWYVCDDAYLMAVSEEAVRNCQAYMLFYAQKDLVRRETKHELKMF